MVSRHQYFSGCGYYRQHKFQNKKKTGRAWFGDGVRTASAPGAQQRVHPFRDAEADKLAAALGFDYREALTSSARGQRSGCGRRRRAHFKGRGKVVDPFDTRSARRGSRVARWDPAASLSQDGRICAHSFEAYGIAIHKSSPKPKSEYRKQFKKAEGLAIGTVRFKVLDRLDDDYPRGRGTEPTPWL